MRYLALLNKIKILLLVITCCVIKQAYGSNWHSNKVTVIQQKDTHNIGNLEKKPFSKKEEVEQRSIDKKILVIGTGLAGAGKSTYLKALSDRITNSIYLDKDVINLSLLQGQKYFSDYYDKYVRQQSYDVMLALARNNLKHNKVVILDGYFGDKLTKDFLQDYLVSQDFITKVIYFHCSGNKQLERLRLRGDTRDVEKLEYRKFVIYRREHIKTHLLGLAQMPHLIIDTENDQDLQKNLEKIYQYLEMPEVTNKMLPLNKIFVTLTVDKSMQGAQGFFVLLQEHLKSLLKTEAQRRN